MTLCIGSSCRAVKVKSFFWCAGDIAISSSVFFFNVPPSLSLSLFLFVTVDCIDFTGYSMGKCQKRISQRIPHPTPHFQKEQVFQKIGCRILLLPLLLLAAVNPKNPGGGSFPLRKTSISSGKRFWKRVWLKSSDSVSLQLFNPTFIFQNWVLFLRYFIGRVIN